MVGAINKVTRPCVPGVFLIQQLNANTNATSKSEKKETLLRHPVPGPPIVTVVQWGNVEGCHTNRHSSTSSSCRTSKTNNSQSGLAINGFFSCASTNIFETGATKTSNSLPEYIWTMATPQASESNW